MGIDIDMPIGIIGGMNPATAIERLRTAGLTEQAIGAAVGARQSTINRIRRGQMQPTWEVGRALVAMAEAQQLLDSSQQGGKADAA